MKETDFSKKDFIYIATVAAINGNILKAHERFKDEVICHGWDGPCEAPGRLRRMNTRYVHDESNWTFLCDACWDRCKIYWEGMWDEYYRNCM